MNDDALLVHLRQSLAGPATAGNDFALAAERVCRSVLRHYCCGLVERRGLLEDVAQEALMRVWAGRRKCKGRTGREVAGWIAAVARCTAVDALRGEGPDRLEIDQIVIPTDAHSPEPSDTGSAASIIAELAWSLGTDANEVLWLRLAVGASWQAIGKDLGISWTAARRRYQRAIDRLRVLALAGPASAALASVQAKAAKKPRALASRSRVGAA